MQGPFLNRSVNDLLQTRMRDLEMRTKLDNTRAASLDEREVCAGFMNFAIANLVA